MPLQKNKFNPLGLSVTVTGRLVGENLFRPKDPDEPGKNPYYSLVLVMDDQPNERISEMINKTLSYKFPKGMPSEFSIWGERFGDDDEFQYTKGKYYIHPKSGKKPEVVKNDKDTPGRFIPITEDEMLIYAGAYVAVNISPLIFERGRNNGLTLTVNAVLFVAHGEPITYMDVSEMFQGHTSNFDNNQNYQPDPKKPQTTAVFSAGQQFQQPQTGYTAGKKPEYPPNEFEDDIPF